LEGVEEMIF